MFKKMQQLGSFYIKMCQNDRGLMDRWNQAILVLSSMQKKKKKSPDNGK